MVDHPTILLRCSTVCVPLSTLYPDRDGDIRDQQYLLIIRGHEDSGRSKSFPGIQYLIVFSVLEILVT